MLFDFFKKRKKEASKHYDVIVVGLGAMGSSTLYELSKKGLNVMGVDMFEPPHDKGSSHGNSRIIREAYYEHPSYVPLLRRSYELWEHLEKEVQEKLLITTGGLMIGTPESELVKGCLESASLHNIEVEQLSNEEIKSRFTPFTGITEQAVGVYEKKAGVLFPEKCITSFLSQAKKNGAEIRTGEKVTECSVDEKVYIATDKGEYTADKIVFSCGAWMGQTMGLNLKIERQVLYWFDTEDKEAFSPDKFPVYICEIAPGKMLYGFPITDEKGVKIAFHYGGKITDSPEEVNRKVDLRERELMFKIISRFFGNHKFKFKDFSVCMYSNTPDLNFKLGFHPEFNNVVLLSPCSGHGFKFASVIGEIAMELVTQGKTQHDISLFEMV
jgi:sarcosine oxidase